MSHVFLCPKLNCVSLCSLVMQALQREDYREEVKWQIQEARRNINSFRTSEQQTSCQSERGGIIRAYPDMTDALVTTVHLVSLCMRADSSDTRMWQAVRKWFWLFSIHRGLYCSHLNTFRVIHPCYRSIWNKQVGWRNSALYHLIGINPFSH